MNVKKYEKRNYDLKRFRFCCRDQRINYEYARCYQACGLTHLIYRESSMFAIKFGSQPLSLGIRPRKCTCRCFRRSRSVLIRTYLYVFLSFLLLSLSYHSLFSMYYLSAYLFFLFLILPLLTVVRFFSTILIIDYS